MNQFERIIFQTLIIVGMLYIAYQTLDLIWLFGGWIYRSIVDTRFYISEEGRPIAGLFFGILLSLEVVETIKVFARGHLTKVRIILLVGLIAVTRKILMISDIAGIEPVTEFAIAALILSLSAGYYLVSRTQTAKSEAPREENTPDP